MYLDVLGSNYVPSAKTTHSLYDPFSFWHGKQSFQLFRNIVLGLMHPSSTQHWGLHQPEPEDLDECANGHFPIFSCFPGPIKVLCSVLASQGALQWRESQALPAMNGQRHDTSISFRGLCWWQYIGHGGGEGESSERVSGRIRGRQGVDLGGTNV